MQKTKEQKAITLIALIITIIVLLILAVVTIGAIRNDGIINYAKNARDDYEDAQGKENDILTGYMQTLDNAVPSGNSEGTATFSKVAVGEEATENSTISGRDYSATNPVIPTGFKAINTETSKWDAAGGPQVTKGLVISDGTSEFVWIPVDNIDEMARETSGTDANGRTNYQGVLYDFSGTTATEMTDSDSREPDNLSSPSFKDEASRFSTITWTETLYQESFNKMVESVKEYKGFYVGRYETSLSGNMVGSISGATPMKERSWFNMYEKSLTYSASNENLGVESEIIWGCQWDAMLRFILTNDEDADHVTATGNVAHNLSNPYETGSVITDIASNIYDLEGNVNEWTQQASGNYGREDRGGNYYQEDSADHRHRSHSTYGFNRLGSRLSLYVKV